ncbi:hypothetical protein R5R35_002524 [Gryllus longicercus]|uniref:Protein yippee-like n=1 Tax=Gryllus longicercus TaxID=2509291 RepID=A0AAN9Z3D8_9ORTH
MGRVFLRYLGGNTVYSCASCEATLTNKDSLISTRFTGATGRAYMFKQVVNVTLGEVEQRIMMTGKHFVRDVYCIDCATKLGWFYEFTPNADQQYKEGKYILEKSFIVELRGLNASS